MNRKEKIYISDLDRDGGKTLFSMVLIYIYQMVTQKILGTCEGKQDDSEIIFRFVTALDL